MYKQLFVAAAIVGLCGGANLAQAKPMRQDEGPAKVQLIRQDLDRSIEEEISDYRDRCSVLMQQFDEANSKNSKAIELRKKAETDCNAGETPEDIANGLDKVTQALKMIGMTPKG